MQRVLTAQQDKVLRRERELLAELRVQLARLDASEEDLGLLLTGLKQLEELFLLVVVGEFNAGKSAFLNALLGDRYLKEGVTPTTGQINLLRYGEGPEVTQERLESEVVRFYLPVSWLQEVNLVDTPGTNAVIQRHQEITEHFVPRSDLVLFVTSADRPFSESERQFLERIRQWGKKIVIVLNKIDLMEDATDLAQVIDFVRTNARQLLGSDPQIFPVSARLALKAKQAAKLNGGQVNTDPQWALSRFEALENFIRISLDSTERVRLKLGNPLGVAEQLLRSYREIIVNRQTLLREDFQTLDVIDEQLDAYQVDMRRDFRYQRDRVDNVLYAMMERGDSFFDDTLRITRILELINAERMRGEFERVVMADTSREIEQYVGELIDWMVDKDYRQWQAVMEYLNRRVAEHSDRMVGKVGSEFEFNRQKLLASVGRSAREVVDSYDRGAEALKLGREVQRAIIQTAAVEVGALGLGAVLVAVLQTTMLDVTGVLGASAVAALGLYVLPYRRQKIKADLRTRITDLRERLDAAMTRQFNSELQESVQRIKEAIAPYTRFVRVEREKLDLLDGELARLHTELATLNEDVRSLK
ncbi:MAG: dynamin family protein [Caldilineaceae bacterium]|nr:dynamin family protein [Caldilineaceae bacterium]MBP8108309.1 dynamin family protein [Caldilineaceae bacterium]MBP8124027.1 dynamin family protein [Caldilineaceae bacterium]MBP9071873.1 dynamin family protein [Caldilineaceae bacterium]